jgi:glutamate dehydrogenase
MPAQLRVVETLETAGRIDRAVDGLGSNATLLRRVQDGHGLTRPELAVILSHGKLMLQAAIESGDFADDPLFDNLLSRAFPTAMRTRFARAIVEHRLHGAIVATKMANRVVNRLGLVAPFELAEEEGLALEKVAAAYFVVDALLDLERLFDAIEQATMPEASRLTLLAAAGEAARIHVADLLRASAGEIAPAALAERLRPGVERLQANLDALLRQEARLQAEALRSQLNVEGADPAIVETIIRLHELDGAFGTASLAAGIAADEITVTQAYVRLGEVLGLDWARAAAQHFVPNDPWERLLAAGLVREFEQLRLEFIARAGGDDPIGAVDRWVSGHEAQVAQFRALIERIRQTGAPTAAMLAQIAAQSRTLLGR